MATSHQIDTFAPNHEPFDKMTTEGSERPTTRQRHLGRTLGRLPSTRRTVFWSGAGKLFVATEDLNELTDEIHRSFGGQVRFDVKTHETNLYYKVIIE